MTARRGEPGGGADKTPALAGAPDGIEHLGLYSVIMSAPDGRAEFVNAGFERLTGYSLAEVAGQFPTAVLSGPETDLEVVRQIREACLTGQHYSGELQVYHKSGRALWLHIEMGPVFHANGELRGFLGLQTDITRHKQIEAELRAREASFRSAFALSRIGAWSVDRDRGMVRYSPEIQSFFAFPTLEEPFEAALLQYPPEYREAIGQAFMDSLINGAPLSYVAELEKDGQRITVQALGEAEIRDGKVIALNGVLQDISRRAATQSLLDQKDRYAAGVMDSVDARMGVVDASGEIIHANRTWRERLHALSQQRNHAFTWNFREQLAHIQDEYGRELERGINSILAGEVDRFSSVFRSNLSDPPTWFKLDAAALNDAGEAKLVVIQHNITELKETEAKLQEANAVLSAAKQEAEAANIAKSKFLANLSHEIRTPLNGVVAIADMLAQAPLGSVEHEMVETIRTSARTLSSLLADMLDLARIESGRVELELAPFHLGEAVRSVAALSDLIAREKGVSLVCVVAPEADAWVLGDINRIKQVLTNLVSNAVKFTGRGSVDIQVDALDEGHFRMVVTDTGIGFDAGDQTRLFDRFEQADSSVNRQYGGSGLGLSIVRELVELMDGQLDCVSVQGAGSTFTVVLPLARAAAPAPAPVRADRSLGLEGRLSILVVDDHPINRRVIELILSGVDVALTLVDNGQIALEMLTDASHPFDLVLMDMQMPVMDGLTATRLLREHEARHGLKRLPVIMVSANAMSAHITDSLVAGADLHLSKPLAASSLLDAIAEVLAPASEAMPPAVVAGP